MSLLTDQEIENYGNDPREIEYLVIQRCIEIVEAQPHAWARVAAIELREKLQKEE